MQISGTGGVFDFQSDSSRISDEASITGSKFLSQESVRLCDCATNGFVCSAAKCRMRMRTSELRDRDDDGDAVKESLPNLSSAQGRRGKKAVMPSVTKCAILVGTTYY